MGTVLGTPTFTAMAVAAAIALVFAFLLSWGLDKAFLRRLVKDRIACIAYGCILAFLLLMGGATWLLTASGDFYGSPIVIPPIGFAIAFLLGVGLAGAARMAIYSRYEGNLDEAIVFEPDYDDPRLYDLEIIARDEQHGHRNYFVRHWVGHLPLVVSYWVNGTLIPILVFAACEFAAYEAKVKWASLRAIAIVALAYLVVAALLWVWSSVGIWRSAAWHRKRGGAAGWGFAARSLVLLGALLALFRSGNLALQAAEWGHLATGRDSIGDIAAMSVSKDGRALAVKGVLAEGAAARFETLLDASPNVREIVLTSDGGRMLEAEEMAKAIHKRGLDTRVAERCMSACTSVLLAGRARIASEGAQIGFHQPSFPGLGDDEQQAAVAQARAEYVAAGVDPAFVWRAMMTPPKDIWVPRQDELIAAHVLTDTEIVVGGTRGKPGKPSLALGPRDPALHAQLEALAARFNALGPVRTDAATTLDRVDVDGLTVTRHYTVRIPRGATLSRAKAAVALRRQVCSHPEMAAVVGQGVTIVESVRDGAGRPLLDARVTDCPGL